MPGAIDSTRGSWTPRRGSGRIWELSEPARPPRSTSGRSSTSSVTEPPRRIPALRRQRLRASQNFRHGLLGAARGVHDKVLLRRQLGRGLPGAQEALEQVLARVGQSARPATQPLSDDALRRLAFHEEEGRAEAVRELARVAPVVAG